MREGGEVREDRREENNRIRGGKTRRGEEGRGGEVRRGEEWGQVKYWPIYCITLKQYSGLEPNFICLFFFLISFS